MLNISHGFRCPPVLQKLQIITIKVDAAQLLKELLRAVGGWLSWRQVHLTVTSLKSMTK